MYALYLIALIPFLLGAAAYAYRKEIVWFEWLGAALVGLLVAAVMHAAAIRSMTDDVETWSGMVRLTTHHPRWVEEYTVTVTEYDEDGDVSGSHTETRHTTHPEFWDCNLYFGKDRAGSDRDENKDIPESLFKEMAQKFGKIETETPYKSGFDSGDRNIYVAYNKTGYVYPVTTSRTWQNRVKAAPTVFSFAKVPKGVPVFEYPKNRDWMRSNRLLGTAAKTVDVREFDLMNSRLGPKSRVNVIMVGFDSADSQLGHWQEAKWIGGKKNDLVICYGGSSNAVWSYAFGWTEKMDVKRNLESMTVGKRVGTSILPDVEAEIARNYVIKDWKKFDYISIEVPWWAYLVEIILMAIAQAAYWFWAASNDLDKGGSNSRPWYDRMSSSRW